MITVDRDTAPWRLAWGLILISLGGIFLFRTFGLIEIRPLAGQFWPLAFIVIGIAHLLQDRNRSLRRAIFWIGFGGLFLVTRYTNPGIHMGRFIFPAAMIAFGIHMLYRGSINRRHDL